MNLNQGVFSVMGNTFRLWASFCEERSLPINSLFVKHISERGFIQVAVPVAAKFVEEFQRSIPKEADLKIGQIDGDVQPASLWLGQWTHFTVRHHHLPVLPSPPPAETRSERFLRRLLNGDIRYKPRRTR